MPQAAKMDLRAFWRVVAMGSWPGTKSGDLVLLSISSVIGDI